MTFNPSALNDSFLIRIYDDAISESTEKLDIKVSSNDIEVGADTLMTIILNDNDYAPCSIISLGFMKLAIAF